MKRLFLLVALGGFLTAIARINVVGLRYDVKTHQMSQREVEKTERKNEIPI
jgi:hypothetical protein